MLFEARLHQSHACNFYIGGDGIILEGRGWTVEGEHTSNVNRSSNYAICVAFIGNYQNSSPKQLNIQTFFKFLDNGVATQMLRDDFVINAQKDFADTDSPGLAFYNVITKWTSYKNYVLRLADFEDLWRGATKKGS